MKHIKIYEDDSLLNDLDALSGKGQLTARCYGWFVTYYSGERHDPVLVGVSIIAPSEQRAIRLFFTQHFGLEETELEEFIDQTMDKVNFFSASYAFQEGYQQYDDTIPLFLNDIEMTPKNRSLDAEGVHDITVQNPYKCVEELDRLFTDARGAMHKAKG